MPFDTMPAVPQPLPDRLMALKNLAWLLRHPNHWPEGFAWEYTDNLPLCSRLVPAGSWRSRL